MKSVFLLDVIHPDIEIKKPLLDRVYNLGLLPIYFGSSMLWWHVKEINIEGTCFLRINSDDMRCNLPEPTFKKLIKSEILEIKEKIEGQE